MNSFFAKETQMIVDTYGAFELPAQITIILRFFKNKSQYICFINTITEKKNSGKAVVNVLQISLKNVKHNI